MSFLFLWFITRVWKVSHGLKITKICISFKLIFVERIINRRGENTNFNLYDYFCIYLEQFSLKKILLVLIVIN